MPQTPARKRVDPRTLQPVLNDIAKRNARARELAAAMQMPCTACRRSLASHIGTGNRWKGCAK
jgi:hypothetical protein